MSEIFPRGEVWGGRPPGPALPTRLPGPWRILASQMRYQLALLTRNPRALAAGLILPGCLLALERGNAKHITMAQAAPKIAGLVALSAVAIAFFTHANGLVVAREDGVLRRWRASPLPGWAYFAGRIAATMLVTAAAGLILVLVAVATTGVHLTAHAMAGLLAVDMFGALALAAAGTAITAVIPSAQSAQPVLMLTYIPLIVLSGAFGAISSLPHWVNTAMTYLPVQPAIDAASRVLQQSGGAIMSAHDLAVLVAWVVGGLLASFWFFAWDPHRPAHARPARARTPVRSE
jgi:ABC-2 type transport system permease protein